MPDTLGRQQPVAGGKGLFARNVGVGRVPHHLQILMGHGVQHARGFAGGGNVAGVLVFDADHQCMPGGLFGQGWLHGHQGSLGYVPERTTDFVFAVYAEQFGLAGCLLLLAVFTVLIVRLARSAAVASDRFGHLLCAGMAVILGTQVIQNVGMNIGATPIAGIPLPLISHGGSASIAFLAGQGLVQSVMLGRRAVLHQEPRPLDSYLLGESGTVRLPM